MALSEKGEEDKKKLKSGVIGVAVLIVLGALAPVIIAETTGVDIETLCVDDGDNDASNDECLGSDEFKKSILEILGYASYVVAIVGFVALIVVGVKY